MYYFLSQTAHLIGNGPVMMKIFMSTLRGLAYTWFIQLPPGTIKAWFDVEREFLSRYMRMILKYQSTLFLQLSRRKAKQSKVSLSISERCQYNARTICLKKHK